MGKAGLGTDEGGKERKIKEDWERKKKGKDDKGERREKRKLRKNWKK